MKKEKTARKQQPKQKQSPKWQSGPWSRRAQLAFIFPTPFLALCRLTGVTPETLLDDFIHNLAHGSWKREGRDEARAHLVEYFLAHGYGQHHYTEEDIRRMFREMDALGALFPKNGKSGLLNLHVRWRKKHGQHWFKQ